MSSLNEQIKTKKFDHFIYIAGEETYLVDGFSKAVVENVLTAEERELNYHRFASEEITVDILEDLIDTVSFFNDKKLIFINGDKISSDVEAYLADRMASLDESIYILVKSAKLDARKKFYKAIKKHGTYQYFEYYKQPALEKFIVKYLAKEGLNIRKNSLEFFIDYVGFQLTNVVNELNKLIDFVHGKEVQKRHIEQVCTRSVESSIFKLVDTFGSAKLDEALSIYEDLTLSKVTGSQILFMINRQFDLIYQSKKMLTAGMSIYEIASFLKTQDFIIKKAYAQGRNMSMDYVEEAFKKSVRMTGLIREGVYEEADGVRQLIIELSAEGSS